jgi:hypothetical protein
MTMFTRLLEDLSVQSSRANRLLDVCQIGANDGRINDPIYNIMMSQRHATRILLIEPQVDVIPYLRANYAGHPEAIIWAGAIAAAPELVLHRLRPELYGVFERRYLRNSPAYRVPSGFSSSSREHVMRHVSGNLPGHIDLADAIEELRAPCSRLQALLQDVNWKGAGIDVLQVDTEGEDDATIYACDLEQLKPILINFEHAHLSPQRTRVLYEYLIKLGYRLYRYHAMDSLAVHVEQAALNMLDLNYERRNNELQKS